MSVRIRGNEQQHRGTEQLVRAEAARLPCLDEDGQLAGVISLSDIAQLEEAGEATETLRQISQREVRN